jgi:hypothetical protein
LVLPPSAVSPISGGLKPKGRTSKQLPQIQNNSAVLRLGRSARSGSCDVVTHPQGTAAPLTLPCGCKRCAALSCPCGVSNRGRLSPPLASGAVLQHTSCRQQRWLDFGLNRAGFWECREFD